MKTTEQRFWDKVQITPGCWLWLAAKNGKRNYGAFGEFSRKPPTLAHRYSWKLHNGVIPDGMHVLHKCDNPPCVNPDHLFLGTQLDNTHDMIAKGRRRIKTKGVVIGFELAEQLRLQKKSGKTGAELAREYRISPSTIYLALRGVSWVSRNAN